MHEALVPAGVTEQEWWGELVRTEGEIDPKHVRELRNVAEQATVMVRQNPLSADVVRPLLRGVSASAGLTLAPRPGVGSVASPRSAVRSARLGRSTRSRPAACVIN